MATQERTSLIETMLARAREEPERIAFVFVGDNGSARPVTRADLRRRTGQYAAALTRQRVGRGDVVLLAVDHGVEQVSLFLGAIAIGAIPCIFPCNTPKLDLDAYLERLTGAAQKIRPALLVVQQSAAKAVPPSSVDVAVLDITALQATAASEDGDAMVPAPARADDVAFLQLSSGSTGRQKAIPVTHGSVFNCVEARNAALQIDASDVIVGWVPLYHDLGLVGDVLTPLITGLTSVVISTLHWLARPVVLMEAIDRYGASVCTMPNFAFNYCVRRIEDAEMAGLDLGKWRVLCNAAERVRPDSFTSFADRFTRWGFRAEAFIAGYGLAENTLTVTMTPLRQPPRVDWIDRSALQDRGVAVPTSDRSDAVGLVSCGVPLPNAELAIRSDEGESLPDRHVGELVVRSNCMFQGYVDDPERTAEALRDGWLCTGDIGYLVEGELYVCGRKKDVIVVGGTNVYAEDVEVVASRVKGFRPGRVVAFGVPDEHRDSEKIVVLGELHDPAAADARAIASELRRTVKKQLDVTLADVEFVSAGWIAKTTSGKISRWENRSKWLATLPLRAPAQLP